jgi:hypothetical protein
MSYRGYMGYMRRKVKWDKAACEAGQSLAGVEKHFKSHPADLRGEPKACRSIR